MFTHKNQQPNGRYERDACFVCMRKLGLGFALIGRLHGLTEGTVTKLFGRKARISEPRYEGFDADWVKLRLLKSSATRTANRERNVYCPVANEVFREERKAELKRQNLYDKMYHDYHKKGFYGKRANCLKYRKKKRLRAIVRNAWFGISSDSHCLSHLGCTVAVFTKHIEDQMEDGWTRENYGKVWNFDHIKPCADFDVFDPDHLKILNHYTNIRPMCVIENARKGKF